MQTYFVVSGVAFEDRSDAVECAEFLGTSVLIVPANDPIQAAATAASLSEVGGSHLGINQKRNSG